MILYENTFENIKVVNYQFPIEDNYYSRNNLAVVADGITRDPIGVKNLDSISFEEQILHYPNPSGASMASKIVCETFSATYDDLAKGILSLKQVLIKANEQVRKLNEQYIKHCDYLENDFYGTVAAVALIRNHILYYSYICDCGVAIFDKDGMIKFKTTDDMQVVNKHFDMKSFDWNEPEGRIIVRKNYRNNTNNIYSYGAITGEETAKNYIKEGSIKLSNDDIVIVYSDGFANYLYENEFYDKLCKLICGDKLQFQQYLEKMSNLDYRRFGKEKTMVVMKNG